MSSQIVTPTRAPATRSDERASPGLEVAALVEDVVGRQQALAVHGDDAAAARGDGGVEDAASRAGRVARERAEDPERGAGRARDPRAAASAVRDEVRPLDQVAGRVAADGELRERARRRRPSLSARRPAERIFAALPAKSPTSCRSGRRATRRDGSSVSSLQRTRGRRPEEAGRAGSTGGRRRVLGSRPDERPAGQPVGESRPVRIAPCRASGSPSETAASAVAGPPRDASAARHATDGPASAMPDGLMPEERRAPATADEEREERTRRPPPRGVPASRRAPRARRAATDRDQRDRDSERRPASVRGGRDRRGAPSAATALAGPRDRGSCSRLGRRAGARERRGAGRPGGGNSASGLRAEVPASGRPRRSSRPVREVAHVDAAHQVEIALLVALREFLCRMASASFGSSASASSKDSRCLR